MDKKITILEVISSLKPIGGAETFAVNLSVALNKKVNLHVAVLYDEANDSFLSTLKNNGINVSFFHKKRGVDINCAKLLREFIIKNDVRFIHTENNALITTFLAIRKKQLYKKITVLHTIHTLPGLEGGKISDLLMKYIFRNKYAIPVNIIDDDNVKKYYGLDYVPLVENGIDCSRFESTIPLTKRTTDLVMFARFTEQKNHKLAVEIFEKIVRKNENFRAYLYGVGPLKETIKELVKDKNLTQNVLIKDSLPNSEIPKILSNAKISFLCSVWEMKSIAIIEALSSGCVMVASNCVGNRTIIDDGKNGFLVANDSVDNYVKLIDDIINNPSSYQNIADNAVTSSKKYSIDFTAEAYIKLFLENKK